MQRMKVGLRSIQMSVLMANFCIHVFFMFIYHKHRRISAFVFPIINNSD